MEGPLGATLPRNVELMTPMVGTTGSGSSKSIAPPTVMAWLPMKRLLVKASEDLQEWKAATIGASVADEDGGVRVKADAAGVECAAVVALEAHGPKLDKWMGSVSGAQEIRRRGVRMDLDY